MEGPNAMAVKTRDGVRRISFGVNTYTGDITISETRGIESSTVRKGVSLPYGTYTILANKRRDWDTWHVLIESEVPIRVQSDPGEQGQALIDANRNGEAEAAQAIALRMKRYLLLGKYEKWFSLNQVRYVEVIVPDCDRSTVTDMDSLESLFRNLDILQPDISPTDFVTATRAALDVEKRLAEEEAAEKAREDITCHFFHPPGREQQLHVRISEASATQSPTSWSLGPRETIIFRRKGRLMNTSKEVIQKESVFANVPPNVPLSQELLSQWTGRTYFRGTTLYAKIENDLSYYIDKDLLKYAFATVCTNVSVRVVTDKARRERIDRGLEMLEQVMLAEQNSLEDDRDVAPSMPQYKLNLRSLFLGRVAYDTTTIPRLQLKPGQTWELTRQGGNTTQRQAILAAITASEGIACIQGPPATGKTSTIGHLLCNAIDILDPRGGLIVCGAKGNEAVYVMAARFRQIYRDIHGDEAAVAKIVIVDTELKQQYARLTGEAPRDEIKPLLLRSHMKRIAKSNLDRYTGWLAGQRIIKLRGHIRDNKIYKTHAILSRELIEIIKSKQPVCFSTLATMHCYDVFFRGHKGVPAFNCSLFICDEASQVAPPSYAQSIITLNPTAVVLCGDHKQLSPYLKSNDNLPMLRKSVFERHILKGATSVVLDEEYRTRQEIYCGTNIHYGNTVKVASQVHAHDTEFYTEFMKHIGRISFLQTVFVDGELKDQHTYLSHNVHFINVNKGECEKLGETETCINKKEAEVIRGIIGCLLICGMPRLSAVALTGYKGQHDLLKNDLARWGIRIRTIEGFQGGEEDFIIFSAVRTPESGIGFISRPSKQNVATSRAKDAFFIVGNFDTFRQAYKRHPHWINTINALREYSPAQNENFQIDIEGDITAWCVDGVPVELGDIAADFVETFDDPMLAAGVDEEEQEDNDDGLIIVEEDPDQW